MTDRQPDCFIRKSTLPRPVQEHLARQLRAVYSAQQEPPAYLGDPGLPVGFDEPLHRLAASERSRERRRADLCGLQAVGRALYAGDVIQN